MAIENIKSNKKGRRPRYPLVDILAVFFGISSWIEICGVGVELPIMVQRLPEKWRLASYVVIVTQLANIGPLLYASARRYWSHKVLEIPAIHITLSVAALSCLLLSFFWDKTTIVGGQEHSTAFLTLVFWLAFVDCTSSVLYLPYMANFRDIYVLSCMIGEGMSGMLPSLVGLVQGVGGNPECQNKTVSNGGEFGNDTVTKLVPYVPNPRFSIEIYFIFLFLMVLVSWVAFILLEKLPRIQKEKTFSCLPYGNIAYHLSVNFSMMSNPIACIVAMFLPLWKLRPIAIVTIFSSIWGAYILAAALLSPYPPFVGHVFGAVLIVFSWVALVGGVSYVKACIVGILRQHSGNTGLFWGGALSQVGSLLGGVVTFFLVNYTQIFKSSASCPGD